jgi:hypothetical protein
MQTRLIDHLRDAAGDALELFRDKVDADATEADLIAALLHYVDEHGTAAKSVIIDAYSKFQWGSLHNIDLYL